MTQVIWNTECAGEKAIKGLVGRLGRDERYAQHVIIITGNTARAYKALDKMRAHYTKVVMAGIHPGLVIHPNRQFLVDDAKACTDGRHRGVELFIADTGKTDLRGREYASMNAIIGDGSYLRDTADYAPGCGRCRCDIAPCGMLIIVGEHLPDPDVPLKSLAIGRRVVKIVMGDIPSESMVYINQEAHKIMSRAKYGTQGVIPDGDGGHIDYTVVQGEVSDHTKAREARRAELKNVWQPKRPTPQSPVDVIAEAHAKLELATAETRPPEPPVTSIAIDTELRFEPRPEQPYTPSFKQTPLSKPDGFLKPVPPVSRGGWKPKKPPRPIPPGGVTIG